MDTITQFFLLIFLVMVAGASIRVWIAMKFPKLHETMEKMDREMREKEHKRAASLINLVKRYRR